MIVLTVAALAAFREDNAPPSNGPEYTSDGQMKVPDITGTGYTSQLALT